MQVLFVHKHYPGQFKRLSTLLAADPGNRVAAIGDARSVDPHLIIPGVELIRYLTPAAAPPTHPFLRAMDAGIRRAQIVASAAETLRKKGFAPDLIIAHPGWGEALYVKDLFPAARMIGYFEFYYRAEGADLGFDPEYPATFDDRCLARTLNAVNLLSLEACDCGVSPTIWQHSLHPAELRSKITVIHEGIDTDAARPNPTARMTLPDGRCLAPGAEVVTFVARNLEPYRGFHAFMRALPALLARRPRAVVLIVGGEGTSYGPPLPPGESHKARLLAELGTTLDLSRVYFLGSLPHARYLDVLAVSAAHVYLTYPFVLSWSMLEAMACECAVIGSATSPVIEVIEDGRNGRLVDFFDAEAMARIIAEVLDDADGMRAMRRRARQTVLEHYDLAKVSIPRYLALIDDQLGRRDGPESSFATPSTSVP
jgi:glycosyltransferase involved in cell wall biosynthesis